MVFIQLQIFLVVSVCCLLLVQVSLGKPCQWERDLTNSVRDLESSHVLLLFSDQLGSEARAGIQTKASWLLMRESHSWNSHMLWEVVLWLSCLIFKGPYLANDHCPKIGRANSAQHHCKVLNILKDYSSMWKHLSMFKIVCKANFPGAAAEKYCIKFVLPAPHYYV